MQAAPQKVMANPMQPGAVPMAQPAMAVPMAAAAVPMAGNMVLAAGWVIPTTRDVAMQRLAQTGTFLIKQDINIFEVVAGCCEQTNTYRVYSGDIGQPLFVIKERSECCCRLCCNPYHPFFLDFYLMDVAGMPAIGLGPVFTMERPGLNGGGCPCCFNCCDGNRDKMVLYRNPGPTGTPQDQAAWNAFYKKQDPGKIDPPLPPHFKVGSAIEGGCCGDGHPCTPTLHLSYRDQTARYAVVEGPMIFGGCSELCCKSPFVVSKPEAGQEGVLENGPWPLKIGNVAEITKRAPADCMGAIQEACTDADVYTLEIKDPTLELEQRATLMATLVLIDYMFFEKDEGPCRALNRPGEHGGVACTLFMCYCMGCVQPCTIKLENNKQ